VEQDAYSINSAVGSKQHPESTLLVPSRKDVQATTDKSGTKAIEVSRDWVIVKLPTLPIAPLIARPPVVWGGGHTSITEFVNKVSKVQGVRCIVVEDVDERIIHFTTFADPLTEQTRDVIYAIEASVVDSYPDLVFDFHLRDSSETIGGTPTAIPGQRFFAVWGGLDENSSRTPQAGQR
jgi:hypothetical protein